MTSSYPPQPDVTNPSTDAPDRAMDWFGLASPRNVMHRDSPLSVNARIVYVAMTFYASGADRTKVRPSISALMGHTALSRSAVLRARKELVEAGVAVVVKQGVMAKKDEKGIKTAPTEYQLNDTDAHRNQLWNEDDEWVGGGICETPPQVSEGHHPGICETPPQVSVGDGGGVSQIPGEVSERSSSSTSDQVAAPASSTTDQSKATPDARGSAEGSLAKEERAGDATPPLADPDLPAEWQTLLGKIDDHLATQLLPVLDCYWTHLVASGKPRYPDQLSAILSELIMLVQDRRVDEVIAGIEWTFGGSGCNFPHKAGALREYMTTRSDPHMVHRLAQEPNASEARQRVLQAKSPRPRPTRAVPAALAPSATEAAEKRERLLAMRSRAGGASQPVSAPDAQPVAETTPYVETRSPELMARLQATLYRASA